MFVIQYEPKFGELNDFVCALVNREIKKRGSEYDFESADIGLPMKEGDKFIVVCRFDSEYERIETRTYFGVKGITKYNKDDIISTDSINLVENGRYKQPDMYIDGMDEIITAMEEIEELIYSGDYANLDIVDSLDDDLEFFKGKLGNELPYPISVENFNELHDAVLNGGAAQADTSHTILSVMIHNPFDPIENQKVEIIVDINSGEEGYASDYTLISRSRFKNMSYEDFCLEIVLLLTRCYNSIFGEEQ